MHISTTFLEKYNRQGPRYTSYPPATAFHTQFSSSDFLRAVQLSNRQKPENVSLYIHIPFCPQRCYFCGCNTSSYENDDKVIRYVECLKKEIKTIAEHIDKGRVVTQIHWGGGTPNAIKLHLVAEVMDLVRKQFTLSVNCEIAMECSPAYLELSDIDTLKEIGFNRISLGIQDFNAEVLEAINRKAPKNEIEKTLAYLKEKGFKGVNLDLVYGLPLQTIESFDENIRKALRLNPDRLVTFSYAHVPWFNDQQKKMENLRFPGPDEKLTMLVNTINLMSENGYETIGMDHFAKPDDELAIAKQTRTLHRNFQGYCTKASTGQVYAFGASSISQLGSCYAQNIKQIDRYMQSIEETGTAIERGYLLSMEECIIRDVINEIMCNGLLNFEEVANRYQLTSEEVKSILKFDIYKLKEFIDDQMVTATENVIQVSETGMLVVRNIAMAFDPALETGERKYSQTL